MLNFYYSEDLGLLDRRAKLFRKEHPNLVIARNPNPGELFMMLSQGSAVEESDSFLIEGYSGSLESLCEIFPSINLNGRNILFLIHSNEDIKIPEGFLEMCENDDPKIVALNERTKRSYITNLMKESGVKLSPFLSKLIKDSLPSSATEINDFITKLSCLDSPRLNEDNIRDLLGDIKIKVDYFSFIYLYLKDDMEEWIVFFNRNIITEESHRKLFHSLVHKILELKKFLTLRKKITDLKKIASKMKTQYYFLFEFENIWKMYGESLWSWLDEFIICLYFFSCRRTQTKTTNVDLFKYFLLQNRIKLIKVD